MNRTESFHLDGFDVTVGSDMAELSRGDEQIRITFFESGVYTVREPGRGHAGKFPVGLMVADARARVAFALQSFAARPA